MKVVDSQFLVVLFFPLSLLLHFVRRRGKIRGVFVGGCTYVVASNICLGQSVEFVAFGTRLDDFF